jgi:hypothetical protein
MVSSLHPLVKAPEPIQIRDDMAYAKSVALRLSEVAATCFEASDIQAGVPIDQAKLCARAEWAFAFHYD